MKNESNEGYSKLRREVKCLMVSLDYDIKGAQQQLFDKIQNDNEFKGFEINYNAFNMALAGSRTDAKSTEYLTRLKKYLIGVCREEKTKT